MQREREIALKETELAQQRSRTHESKAQRVAREAEEAAVAAERKELERIAEERAAAARREAARKGRVSGTLKAKFAMFEGGQ